MIGDYDIGNISNENFHEVVSYITQDEFVFMDNLRFNLKIANPDAADSTLLSALNLVYMLSKNDDKSTILEKIIADQGVNISGGQRQWLSLAWLFLRQPDIIILDEITSSVDTETEIKILNNIRSSFPSATIIHATHRPASLKSLSQ